MEKIKTGYRLGNLFEVFIIASFFFSVNWCKKYPFPWFPTPFSPCPRWATKKLRNVFTTTFNDSVLYEAADTAGNIFAKMSTFTMCLRVLVWMVEQLFVNQTRIYVCRRHLVRTLHVN